MEQRKKLHKLVIMELKGTEINLRASTLYQQIRETNPSILREEGVGSFRSFVKVINSFHNIEAIGTGVKRYGIERRHKG